ncbi:glycosyltransferase family 2 protein [Erythrobacter sp. WG]|uniref:glycosyltransferase family 2 protein n=1 Tax=Erythrobacter sp. WG TaxID=2985510 RepID=UPI00226E4086|nr:glycosyltransferase family 2 protein [Erythrobacter sp. WG]MCX9147986.1 glycosyltransferase family 2 protein [Erythrobacter sp. WG]
MTVQPSPILDDAAWQVPAHEVALYGPRRNAYALVIPVINEGARIRGQLARIADAGLPVDVVIADGGSTDGSLDADFVAGVGVRAVLTKTGPGKLSAQLRMAYAWCLRQGYAGIVTIDGNGKDGVEAVSDMVAKLEEGCDYVQGSRYLPGGAAENTPLERTIANRLIHAPVLSIAGRHWFTDTTNGFRAYSTRYLTHPDVQPFRDVFSVYNLLFYLTVRAGQLGMKVAHVPVARRYPDDGKVPTKIGGLASKLALLGETVTAATGGYTPDAAARGGTSWLGPVAILLALLAPLLWSVVAAPPYSPDSWALWELAQSVFGDFYRFTHWRSYASDLPFSTSFPPLTPVLIAILDAAMGTGPRTGLYLAFACFAGFALTSEAIGRRVTGAPWLGLGAALVLLLGPNLLFIEMSAGRTIPLQLLLYALVLLALVRADPMSHARAAGVGLLVGLAMLNRFDALLLPLAVALAVGWLARSWQRGALVLMTAALVYAPWALWSLATFGTPFASDNAGIAAALDPRAFATDWWPTPQPTLADDPLAWAAKVAANVAGLSLTALSLVASIFGVAILGYLAPPAALSVAARDRLRGSGPLRLLAGTAALAGLMLAPQVLTGYLEYRYLAVPVWAAILAAGCWGIAQGRTLHQRRIFARAAFLVALLAAAGFVANQGRIAGTATERAQAWARFDDPADVRALGTCVANTAEPRILVVGDNLLAARAGGLGGLPTMMEPRNMAEGRLGSEGSRRFVETWRATHILAADPARAGWIEATFPVTPAAGCPLRLYRVDALAL